MTDHRQPLTVMGQRAIERCDFLGCPPFSETQRGLFRPYLSDAYKATCKQVAQWMTEAGLTCRSDAMGNLIGRYEGQKLDQPALLIGSHLDSVINAGHYDGMLGVMMGIELVSHFSSQGKRLPFALEVIGFGDEEGSRFPASMLTSRVVAGSLHDLPLEVCDQEGRALHEVMKAYGLDPAQCRKAAYEPDKILAYLEAHIEQGPVLEDAGAPVGVVTAIAAQYRYRVTLRGVAGHAGTVPMRLRRDALTAASEMVLAVERLAREAGEGQVATIGYLHIEGGAGNVVPGDVSFSLDIRAGTTEKRDHLAQLIVQAVQEIAQNRLIDCVITQQNDLAATLCDKAMTEALAASVEHVTGETALRLVSGAGHDAMIMAALVPVGMVFLRCEAGVSHNPDERVISEDVSVAIGVMIDFIETLAVRNG